MLIVLAGLPATGKSTLAARLAEILGAVVLDKDAVRATLFPPPVRDYSRQADDLVMAAVYSAAAYIRRTFPRQAVVLDGRTYLRAYQVRDLLDLAASLNETPRIIECQCDDDTARARLDSAQVRGGHPAENRTFTLYRDLKAAAEPLSMPRLVLDTGKLALGACVQRCLNYLNDSLACGSG